MTESNRRRPTTIYDIPFEIIIRILMFVNPLDIVTNVCLVSKSWNDACYDPEIWKTMDLNSIGVDWIARCEKPLDENYNYDLIDGPRKILIQVLFKAMEFSDGNIRRLIFHSMTFLRNDDLFYIAISNPKLEHLILPTGNLVHQNGFERAVMNWKDLKSLTLPSNYFPCSMMRIIGDHCKSFSVLKITCPLSFEFSKAIVDHVPWLKSLSLRYTRFDKRGFAHLMKNLKGLEVLNLLHSHMNYHIICRDSDVPELTDDEIIQKVSQIKTVVTCQYLFYADVCECKSKYQDLLTWNHE